VDILCMLHGSSTRGIMTLPMVSWARVMGASVDQAKAIIDELSVMQVADIELQKNADVTVRNRRMTRDDITREQNRLRVQRCRSNKHSNGAVMAQKAEGKRQNIEDRNKDNGAAASDEALADGIGDEPAVMMFSCIGRQSEWPLTTAFLDELKQLYPTIDTLAQCELALAKIKGGAVSKKTARGMSKFLFSWMDRTSNSTRGPGQQRLTGGAVPWQRDSGLKDDF
jgi:hypothetical protein